MIFKSLMPKVALIGRNGPDLDFVPRKKTITTIKIKQQTKVKREKTITTIKIKQQTKVNVKKQLQQ